MDAVRLDLRARRTKSDSSRRTYRGRIAIRPYTHVQNRASTGKSIASKTRLTGGNTGNCVWYKVCVRLWRGRSGSLYQTDFRALCSGAATHRLAIARRTLVSSWVASSVAREGSSYRRMRVRRECPTHLIPVEPDQAG